MLSILPLDGNLKVLQLQKGRFRGNCSTHPKPLLLTSESYISIHRHDRGSKRWDRLLCRGTVPCIVHWNTTEKIHRHVLSSSLAAIDPTPSLTHARFALDHVPDFRCVVVSSRFVHVDLVRRTR